MRKSIYIISILAAGLLLMVYSCSKEEAQTAKSHENTLNPYEIKVHNAIKGFIATMEIHRENPHYKSGQIVSPDSALWLLEATINYSHAFPNEYYIEHEIEDLTLVIPKTSDGMIDMAVLTQKYDQMKSDITTVYYGSSFEDKGLVLVDLEEDSQTETELTLTVQIVTGERGIDPGPGTPGINGPFEVGDDWWYGEEAGKCDENGAEGSDAAEQLQNEIANEIQDPGGNYFFINITEYIVEGGDPLIRRPNDPEDNHLDYYLYYANSDIGLSADTSCIEWPEMNLYYNFLKFLMFSYLPENDPELYGKSIVEVLDIKGYSTIDSYFIVHQKHKLTSKFGVKVGAKDGEGPEEL